MKRRAFVRGVAAAALAAATWPRWLSEAFGAEIPVVHPGDDPVIDAYMRARAAHRMLLVLIIPQEHAERGHRGRVFGSYLNFGTDAQLAPLDGCEVVCSKMAGLSRFHPGTGEPLMLLIDPNGSSSEAVRRLDAPLKADLRWKWEPNRKSQESFEHQVDRQIDGNLAVVAGLIKSALPMPSGVAEAAAVVRARLVKHRVPGSRWANATGCGETIEGETDEVMMGCGMGHVPEKSRRFLYWFKGGIEDMWKGGD